MSGVWRVAPVLALALFGISWSAVLVRLAEAPATSVAFWRLVLSVGVLLPVFVSRRSWREYVSLDARSWGWAAAAAAALAGHFVLWFASLDYTTVASSTVLVAAQPLFVGVLSARWLREPPAAREWAGILVAVVGAGVIGWGDFAGGAEPLLGDALALAAAVCGAVYFVNGRRLRRRLGLWGYVGPVYALAAALVAAVMAGGGISFLGWSPGTWAAFLGLAVGPMLLGHTGFNWALRHVRAYVVSVVMLLEPVGATVIAVWILGRHEVPSVSTAVGGLLTLAGVWLSLRGRAAARARVEPADPDSGGRGGSV